VNAQPPEQKLEPAAETPQKLVKPTDHWFLRLLLARHSSLDMIVKVLILLLVLVSVRDFLTERLERHAALKNSTSIGCGEIHPILVTTTKLAPPTPEPVGVLADMPEAWDMHHDLELQRYANALASANEDKLQIAGECGYN